MEPATISALGAGASAVLGAGGGLLNTLLGNKKRIELADYSYGKDMDMWNIQNKYNHPAQQVARLKEAGLNPNLLYGQGVQGATGQAKEYPKYQKPKIDYTIELPNLLNSLSLYQDIKGKAIDNQVKGGTIQSLIDLAAYTASGKRQDVNQQSWQQEARRKLFPQPEDYQLGAGNIAYWKEKIAQELGKTQSDAKSAAADATVKKATADMFGSGEMQGIKQLGPMLINIIKMLLLGK